MGEVPADLRTADGRSVTVLDTRQRERHRLGHIPGARRAIWTRYRAGWFRSGRLPEDLDGSLRNAGDVTLHLSTTEGAAGTCQIMVDNVDELKRL